MRFDLLALYAGPDQLMGLTSVLAGALGILLIVRNKVVTAFFKITSIFRRTPRSSESRLEDQAGRE